MTYTIEVFYTGSVIVEVEANSEEQAIDKAYRMAPKIIKQQDDFFINDAEVAG